MSKSIFTFLMLIFFACSSCIELVDDLTINFDGSGNLKYTINLSSSKVKINSIFAVDTLNGKRVPKKEEIKNKVKVFKKVLLNQQGIDKVEISENYEEYIFKCSIDFSDVFCLQDAINIARDSIERVKNYKFREFNWVDWNEKSLTRSIPEINYFQENKIDSKDKELLKSGTYTSITRFNNEIESFTNPIGKISKSKKAYMMRTDMNSLIENEKLLETKIQLSSH